MAAAINERELVLETLLQITRDGEYSHIALKNVLDKYQYLDKKERAFITRVVNGTLERMIEIDDIINQFSKIKVNKMKPVIRTILRCGVYQIKYMDSVPDSAACNESVKLAAKKGFTNLKGFVNGVLRNISRNKMNVSYSGLSAEYSLPQWIVDQWVLAYGEETFRKMAGDFLREKPMSVRCNLERLSKEELIHMLEQEGVTVEESGELPYALYLSGYDYLGKLRSFQEGYFYVQDTSSMQVAEWAAPDTGDYVIDVCAAPGGKAIHIAEKLKGSGHVEARDISDYKAGLIHENIVKSRLENIEAVKKDALQPYEEDIEKADIVIADLPCSGLGVLGKKPDLKYKMTPETQHELAALQRKMLSVVKDYVKPGGVLLYSTCTISQEENEENARWFQSQYREFTLIREQQMLPGVDAGDGFYIAMFKKESHE